MDALRIIDMQEGMLRGDSKSCPRSSSASTASRHASGNREVV
jgi:hypothetical protein